MPRKTELQTEEAVAAVGSPLRRSTRININSSAPTSLSSKGNLQSTNEPSQSKTRRASLQEIEETDDKKENKPAPRSRRGSTAKDDIEPKPEPAKTRSRRSSANAELSEKIEESKPITRRRRSSAAEALEPEPVRPLRARRSSVTDKLEEDDAEKRPIRRGRSVPKEEIVKDDSIKKSYRGRRGSVDKEDVALSTEKEQKKPTRGRRSSTDKLETEPEAKNIRLTPSKSRRRLSVTENAVNLDPIEEQIETNRKSITPKKQLKVVLDPSPPKSEDKKPVTRLTPIKSKQGMSIAENKLNLEPIKEHESETKGRESGTPKKNLSVLLNSSPNKVGESIDNTKSKHTASVKPKQIPISENPNFNSKGEQGSDITPTTNEMLMEISKDSTQCGELKLDKQTNVVSVLAITEPQHLASPMEINSTLIRTKSNEDLVLDTKHIIEEPCAESERDSEVCETDLEKSLVQDTNVITNGSENLSEAIQISDINSGEINNQNLKTNPLSNLNEFVKERGSSEGTLTENKFADTNLSANNENVDVSAKVDYADISIGSDGSFRFNLNASLTRTDSQSSRDDIEDTNLNRSKISNDKDNIKINTSKEPHEIKENTKLPDLTSTNVNSQNIAKAHDTIIARVSNVFRPKMKDYSFVEPMDVDECSILLNTTENKTSVDLDESDTESKQSVIKVDPEIGVKNIETNKLDRKDSIGLNEGDSDDESFKLSISIAQVDESTDIEIKTDDGAKNTDDIEVAKSEIQDEILPEDCGNSRKFEYVNIKTAEIEISSLSEEQVVEKNEEQTIIVNEQNGRKVNTDNSKIFINESQDIEKSVQTSPLKQQAEDGLEHILLKESQCSISGSTMIESNAKSHETVNKNAPSKETKNMLTESYSEFPESSQEKPTANPFYSDGLKTQNDINNIKHNNQESSFKQVDKESARILTGPHSSTSHEINRLDLTDENIDGTNINSSSGNSGNLNFEGKSSSFKVDKEFDKIVKECLLNTLSKINKLGQTNENRDDTNLDTSSSNSEKLNIDEKESSSKEVDKEFAKILKESHSNTSSEISTLDQTNDERDDTNLDTSTSNLENFNIGGNKSSFKGVEKEFAKILKESHSNISCEASKVYQTNENRVNKNLDGSSGNSENLNIEEKVSSFKEVDKEFAEILKKSHPNTSLKISKLDQTKESRDDKNLDASSCNLENVGIEGKTEIEPNNFLQTPELPNACLEEQIMEPEQSTNGPNKNVLILDEEVTDTQVEEQKLQDQYLSDVEEPQTPKSNKSDMSDEYAFNLPSDEEDVEKVQSENQKETETSEKTIQEDEEKVQSKNQKETETSENDMLENLKEDCIVKESKELSIVNSTNNLIENMSPQLEKNSDNLNIIVVDLNTSSDKERIFTGQTADESGIQEHNQKQSTNLSEVTEHCEMVNDSKKLIWPSGSRSYKMSMDHLAIKDMQADSTMAECHVVQHEEDVTKMNIDSSKSKATADIESTSPSVELKAVNIEGHNGEIAEDLNTHAKNTIIKIIKTKAKIKTLKLQEETGENKMNKEESVVKLTKFDEDKHISTPNVYEEKHFETVREYVTEINLKNPEEQDTLGSFLNSKISENNELDAIEHIQSDETKIILSENNKKPGKEKKTESVKWGTRRADEEVEQQTVMELEELDELAIGHSSMPNKKTDEETDKGDNNASIEGNINLVEEYQVKISAKKNKKKSKTTDNSSILKAVALEDNEVGVDESAGYGTQITKKEKRKKTAELDKSEVTSDKKRSKKMKAKHVNEESIYTLKKFNKYHKNSSTPDTNEENPSDSDEVEGCKDSGKDEYCTGPKQRKILKNKTDIPGIEMTIQSAKTQEKCKNMTKVAERMVDTEGFDNKQESDNTNSSLITSHPYLYHSKLDQYLAKKMSEMESDSSSYDELEENPEDKEENEYIFTMAEEGEEDTPSEGSNDIVDEGESINSSACESAGDSNDDDDDDDSFICDDEYDLLSGNEYDLGDDEKQIKKSRIVKVEKNDNGTIKITRSEKPVEKKRSRIITITDSSDSEDQELANRDQIIDDKDELENKSSEESNADKDEPNLSRETENDVIVSEEKATRINVEKLNHTNMNNAKDQSNKSNRKSTITIHENINVADIKDAGLSERISSMVDTFCTSIQGGDLSMNLSLELEVNDGLEPSPDINKASPGHIKKREKSSKGSKSNLSDDVFEPSETDQAKIKRSRKKKTRSKKKRKVRSASPSSEDAVNVPSGKLDRLSVTLDDIDSGDLRHKLLKKRRLSQSLEHISDEGKQKKKKKRAASPTKANKTKSSSEDELITQSLGIMNQLLNDVKKRPTRTIVPTRNTSDLNNSWITEIADVKPSTTIISKKEMASYKTGKIHAKDFRTQMLYDSSRVKRIETKRLLQKKGAYF